MRRIAAVKPWIDNSRKYKTGFGFAAICPIYYDADSKDSQMKVEQGVDGTQNAVK